MVQNLRKKLKPIRLKPTKDTRTAKLSELRIPAEISQSTVVIFKSRLDARLRDIQHAQP